MVLTQPWLAVVSIVYRSIRPVVAFLTNPLVQLAQR